MVIVDDKVFHFGGDGGGDLFAVAGDPIAEMEACVVATEDFVGSTRTEFMCPDYAVGVDVSGFVAEDFVCAK